MKNLAQEILNDHLKSDLREIEIRINDENKKDMLTLYRDYSKMGLSPDIQERNDQHYFMVDISSKCRSNVIDISVKRKKNADIIDMQEFRMKKSMSR